MMLRWNAVLVSVFVFVSWLRGGEPLYVPHGADAIGTAFAVTASPGHWNCFHNQALMTDVTSSGVSASLVNRFMIPALSSKAVSAVIVMKPTPFGLVASHYGNADYCRIFTGLGSAVRIAKTVSLGVQIDYISERSIGEYRDLSHVTFEAGMTCLISKSLTLGLHIFNPVSLLNTIPSSIEAGLHWQQSDDLMLAFGSSKAGNEPLSVQCGLSWNVMDRLVLRSGYMSSPSAFAFGMGFRSGHLKSDAGFLLNGVTGVTSSITLTWTIK
ncbi:MAG TPA: hypothetical protein DIS74_08150 [Bacteroidales bacterium]|nr:hypothetical protein [Bacteroidales bacterium]